MNAFLIFLEWYIVGIIPVSLVFCYYNRQLRKKFTYADAVFVAALACFGTYMLVAFFAWLFWLAIQTIILSKIWKKPIWHKPIFKSKK